MHDFLLVWLNKKWEGSIVVFVTSKLNFYTIKSFLMDDYFPKKVVKFLMIWNDSLGFRIVYLKFFKIKFSVWWELSKDYRKAIGAFLVIISGVLSSLFPPLPNTISSRI